jgi:hypothetical protein
MSKINLAEIAARKPFTAAVSKGCTLICLTVAERDALVAALREADRMFEYVAANIYSEFGIIDEEQP